MLLVRLGIFSRTCVVLVVSRLVSSTAEAMVAVLNCMLRLRAAAGSARVALVVTGRCGGLVLVVARGVETV